MSLSDFRPDMSMVVDIKRELTSAGVEGDSIPMDWLEAIAAATFKWIATKPDGLRQVSNLLKGSWSKGRPDEVYTLNHEEIKHDDVYFMKAVLVKRQMIPANSLKIKDKFKVRCDECGTSSHCVKDVYLHLKDRTDSYCNACLTQSDDLRLRDNGDMGMCSLCPDTTCVHNHIHFRRTP